MPSIFLSPVYHPTTEFFFKDPSFSAFCQLCVTDGSFSGCIQSSYISYSQLLGLTSLCPFLKHYHLIVSSVHLFFLPSTIFPVTLDISLPFFLMSRFLTHNVHALDVALLQFLSDQLLSRVLCILKTILTTAILGAGMSLIIKLSKYLNSSMFFNSRFPTIKECGFSLFLINLDLSTLIFILQFLPVPTSQSVISQS